MKIERDKLIPRLKWLWKSSEGIRTKAVLNTLMGLVQVLLDFCFIWSTKLCVDVATGVRDMALSRAVAFLVASVLGGSLLGYARNWVRSLLGAKSQNLMTLKTFTRIMKSAWTGRESLHSGDTMNRLIQDANQITTVITDTLPQLLCVLFRLVGAFIYLYTLQPRLALIMVFIAPVFLLLSRFYARRMMSLSRDIRDAESRIQMIMQENIQNRMLIKSLEQTDFIVDNLSSTQNIQVEKVRRKTRFSSVSSLIAGIGFALGYLVTFVWGVYSLNAHAITYGTMMAFVQLVGQIQGPFRSIANLLPVIISALVSTDRIRELEQVPLESDEHSIMLGSDSVPVGVRFDNVTFRYAQGDSPVLNNLNVDFKPGSLTAVLGETGAGKTTMTRLIMALLHPDSGKIVFYEPDGREVQAGPETRCNIEYVPQGNTLLSGTVRYNLMLGNMNASEEQMKAALHTACADFVLEREEGLDTICGEDGAGLSEGQAQRIAIARSLLRERKIMLLDEVTSALDMETEEQLLKNLSDRAHEHGQTVIFITHRKGVLNLCTGVLDLSEIPDNTQSEVQ